MMGATVVAAAALLARYDQVSAQANGSLGVQLKLEVSQPACQGELLYNGICLPNQWPPRVELTREAPTPSYLSQPPAVINIDVGRQLLVDDFLIASTHNTRRTWYQAKLLKQINPVLRPTKPWETVIDSGVVEPAFSRGFSGGIWWVPAEKVFKIWYGCGAGEMPYFHQGTLRATCVAESTDGRRWEKPVLTATQCSGSTTCIPGTNIVHNVSYAGNVVWLDLEESDPSRLYKMIEDFGPDKGSCSGTCGCPFRLLSSPDGLRWTLRKTTGCTEDRASGFYNPFRKRWVFSIKASGSDVSAATHSPEPFNRHRHYYETPTRDLFGDGVEFTGNPNLPATGPTYAWANADRYDRGWLGAKEGWQDQWPYGALYTVDGVAYESLLVFQFTNFRCKDHYVGCQNVSHGVHPEYDSIDLAFSRDGFSYSRVPAGEPSSGVGVQLDAQHRVPFVPMSPDQNPSDWNYGSVQSIGGSFIIPGEAGRDDTMLVYVGGGAGHSFQDLNATSTIGAAELRRDGFASMNQVDRATAATITSRPITFGRKQKYLFVNADGSVGVEVLRAGDVIARTSLNGTNDGSRQHWAKPTSVPGHTRLMLPLVDLKERPMTLVELASEIVQLRFTLSDSGALFSFWVSPSLVGHSGGYVAAGGPAFSGARDTV